MANVDQYIQQANQNRQNAAVATLTTSVAGKVGHGAAITGTADLITGAVTGSVT